MRQLFAIIYFVSFSISISLGFYAFAKNPTSFKNKLFLLLCLSFSCWGLSFSQFTIAQTYDQAWFWRRFSVLGWGLSYSIALHFIITYYYSFEKRIDKVKVLLLYIPSAILIYVYGINSQLSSEQARIVMLRQYWTIESNNTLFELLFLVYFVASISSIILIVIFRGNALRTKYATKEKLLFSSLIILMILGYLTDIMMNKRFLGQLPGLAPIFLLVVMFSFYYFLSNKKSFTINTTEESVIINETSRPFFVKMVNYIYIYAATLVVSHIFILPEKTNLLFQVAILLIIVSVFIIVAQLFFKKHQSYELFVTITSCLTIFSVLHFFYHLNAAVIMWPLPIAFLVISVLFTKQSNSWLIASSSIIATLVLLPRTEKVWHIVTRYDYITRILYTVFILMLCVVIERIYITRLKENKVQSKFQTLITSISQQVISSSTDNERLMQQILKEIAEHYETEMTFLLYTLDDFVHLNYFFSDNNTENPAIAKQFSEGNLDEHSYVLPLQNTNDIKSYLVFYKCNTMNNDYFNAQCKVLSQLIINTLEYVVSQLQINQLAYYDHLTKLPNRIGFKEKFDELLHQVSQDDEIIALSIIDIDGFKEVNDAIGHEAGDEVLIKLADELNKTMDNIGIVSRFGGDEFLVAFINEKDNTERLHTITTNVLNCFSKPIQIADNQFYLSASCGVALYPLDGETMDDMIKNADTAMYHGKVNGKNQVVFCNDFMRSQLLQLVKLTNSLYRAMDENQLYLCYQPQISLITDEIVGFEALMRWNHPEHGTIPPSVFIPIAEKTGLIATMGNWALKQACQQITEWNRRFNLSLRMAVNVSVKQLYLNDFTSIVKECLESTTMKPELLDLEITESVLASNVISLNNKLKELALLGVELSIDDFGMEYSSLERLKSIPLDRIKIDIEFTRNIGTSDGDEMIELLIYLAKTLQLSVLAEGVETREQVAYLKEHGCDDYQGYYRYKPLKVEEVEQLLVKVN